MPSLAREDDSWNKLDWIEREPPRRSLRNQLRLANISSDDFSMIIDTPDSHTRRSETPKLNRDGWWMAIRDWDIYDYAVIAGIILSCLGFLFALFPQSRTGGILFPIGAALMAFAAYGSNGEDAYTD